MSLLVLNGPSIAAGESLSDAVDCTGGCLARITMPPSWTRAPLTFEFSTDGVFFNPMFGIDGFEVTIQTIAPGSGVIIPSDIGRAIGFLKVRSGTRGNPIPQESARAFAVAIVVDEDAAIDPDFGR